MPNRTWLAAVGTAVVTLATNVAPGRADETPTLGVRVRNDAQLPDRTLEEALMIAGGVYRRAGVLVDWVRDSADDAPAASLTIAIVPSGADVPFAVGNDAMGTARGAEGARATVAYVFYDRVRDFGERGHVDAWVMLGCAIAHELGHLLLPVNSHAPDGIMRANWDPKMIARAGGFLSFAPDQGRLLRLRVASREP
jgi:hypothetical protein